MHRGVFPFFYLKLQSLIVVIVLLVLLLSGGALAQDDPCKPYLSEVAANPEAQLITSTQTPDVALDYWNSRNKYLIIVSATKSTVPDADLSFLKVNDAAIIQGLNKYGYTLVKQLTGESATSNNFLDLLHGITAGEKDIVTIYYNGHGVGDGDDLYLQLYSPDQKTLGPGYGISLSSIVKAIRRTFEGELVIIIDSCFSGTATDIHVPLNNMQKTIMITSSSFNEKSAIMEDSKESIFSHFLSKGIEDRWTLIDSNTDGIIEYQELADYLTSCLHCMYKQKRTQFLMNPQYFRNSSQRFFAYDPSRAKNLSSPVRQVLIINTLVSVLASGARTGVVSVPNIEAISLADSLPTNESTTPYIAGLKLIAHGQMDEAIKELEKALSLSSDPLVLEESYLALGLAQRYKGDYEGAFRTYNTAIELVGESAQLLEEKSYALYGMGQIDESKQIFLTAIEKNVNDPSVPSEVVGSSTEAYLDLLNNTTVVAVIDGQKVANEVQKSVSEMLTKVPF